MSEQKITVIFCAAIGVIVGALLKSFWVGVSSMLILQGTFFLAWYLEYIDALKKMVEHPDAIARPRDIRTAREYIAIEVDEPMNGHDND